LSIYKLLAILRPRSNRRLHPQRDNRQRDVRPERDQHVNPPPREPAHGFSEIIATSGLVLVIFALARTR
jgi:hypothetical protein